MQASPSSGKIHPADVSPGPTCTPGTWGGNGPRGAKEQPLPVAAVGMGQSPETETGPSPPLVLLPQASRPQLTLSTSSFQSCGDHNSTSQPERGQLSPGAHALPQLPGTQPCNPLPLPPRPTQPGAEAGRGLLDGREQTARLTCHMQGGDSQPGRPACVSPTVSAPQL